MKEIVRDTFRVLTNDPKDTEEARKALALFTEKEAVQTVRFHESLPFYEPTPLVRLSAAAEDLGVKAVFVKDESKRFGLKAFKGLGGSYAMFRLLCERTGLDPDTAVFTDLIAPERKEQLSSLTFVTATDGNHGKGVSFAVGLFGCGARVYMPKGSVEARRKAIEDAGSAVCEITPYNYDGTVAYAKEMAEKNGWILIQDTAWDGYEDIPTDITRGYLTLAKEALSVMESEHGLTPTHVFLQAGVGSMAGGISAYLLDRYKDAPPTITICEAEGSHCIYGSALAGDGAAHTVDEGLPTIMAGLNCGTPSKTIWPILRDKDAAFACCKDAVTEDGMRALAFPLGDDPALISGESGAVTFGMAKAAAKDPELREALGLTEGSVILVISTEGDTDPEDYRRVVGK